MKSIKTCLVILCVLGMTTLYAQKQTSIHIPENEIGTITFSSKVPIKNIGIFIYDGFNTLDAMGPYHILSQIVGSKVFFISKRKGLVRNQTGMEVKVEKSIDEVNHLDILVIPGGARETYLHTKDQSLLDWIKRIDKGSVYTGGVCTGGWILGATGLLKGRNVTTNWYRAEEIMKKYGANFKPERYVRDGKYWTSAGVTAGMDMSLAIVNDLMGNQYTQAVMLDLEYDPKPPIDGGSIEKTTPEVKRFMNRLYDGIFTPVMK
ncbi:DJ-1/PfpI family protein [Pedobacter ginsengiterrae]